MRSIALDVHRAFCEVAIKQDGELRSGGRIKTGVAELELFAQSLAPDDQVALEASGPALAIARIIEPTSHALWSPTRGRCARSQRRR